MSHHPVIDVHAHVLLPALQQHVMELDPEGFAAAQDLELRRNGLESLEASGQMIHARWELLTSLETRLAAMDANGVDVQLVSPSPSHFYPFLGEEQSVDVAREANASVARLVEQAPGRLAGLGLVPLQHPARMVEVLEHAVLECGLRGVEIGSYAPDGTGEQNKTIELSDPALEPFWAAAAALVAVVFVLPFGFSLDERLARYYLANTVAQPAENAVALSHLIFSGVLDRYPNLVILAAHAGGYLPTAIGRSDHAWRVRPEARNCANTPSSYLRRIWFDSLTHDRHQLAELVRVVGEDNVLLGSDYPFDMGTDTPVRDLSNSGLPHDVQQQILGGNAAALGLTAGLRQPVRDTGSLDFTGN